MALIKKLRVLTTLLLLTSFATCATLEPRRGVPPKEGDWAPDMGGGRKLKRIVLEETVLVGVPPEEFDKLRKSSLSPVPSLCRPID